MKVGDKVVIKGQKNLWTVEEVFLSGEVSIKSVKTGFKMTVHPLDLEVQ
jgi:hypothetical protein